MSLSEEELEEIKSDFEQSLSELNTPDASIIEALTDIANEYKDVAAQEIAKIIETRIMEVCN